MKYSDNLENWMANLSPSIRSDVPLIHLAIPGSHDSGSYGINRRAKLAPDAEDIVKRIYPFVPCIIRRWSKTQKYSVEDQLMNGIRYFDLRTAFNVHNQNFYLVHGVYCEEISGPLTDLVRFLDEHPKEVVVLDFQHFYDLQAPQHQQLINIIMNNFHSKLFKRSFGDSNLIQLNLNFAYQYRKQIVVIYRNNLLTANEFFKTHDFPTPWPNATNIDALKEYLEKRLESRSPYQGFVTQCVLTPDANFIIPRFYSTLKKKCAKKVDKDMSEWIAELNPGSFREGEKPKVNVILADFVDIHDNKFSKIVVDLNLKLDNRQIDQTTMRSGFKI